MGGEDTILAYGCGRMGGEGTLLACRRMGIEFRTAETPVLILPIVVG